jgi:cytochrome c biogenesis factor
MAFLGNFALLLAFALSVYCFGAGLLAVLSPDEPSSQRLSETARRAGIVVFGAVVHAAVGLVGCAFSDDFTLA